VTEPNHRQREYISTGHLPSAQQVQAAVDEAYRLYRADPSGAASQTYPALARVPGDLFGICVAGIDGSMFRAGDSKHEFAIMSVAKPFVFALVCQILGAEPVRQKLGVNATGLATAPSRTCSPAGTGSTGIPPGQLTCTPGKAAFSPAPRTLR
jgi:glutaminase